jgi:hypothetical protein
LSPSNKRCAPVHGTESLLHALIHKAKSQESRAHTAAFILIARIKDTR